MSYDFSTFRLDPEAGPLANAYQLARVNGVLHSTRFARALPTLREAFGQVIAFGHGRAFGVAAASDADVVVAFRGSDENREWLAALSYGQVAWPVGRVHQGFAETLEPVWKPLLAALFDTGALEKRLWIAGHSLGGALATLTAYRLSIDGIDPYFVATFGAPPVLDPIAARAFTPPLLRVVNSEDPVPEIMWPTLFDTYEHTGELAYLLPSGAVAEPRHARGLALRLDRAHSIGAPLPLSGPVRDHYIASYIEKLERHRRCRGDVENRRHS